MVRFEPARIVVDRDDDERRGRTRVAPEGAAASVARDVNVQRMRTLLSERVFRWAAASGPVLLPVGALA
jgi:hypothetical protein